MDGDNMGPAKDSNHSKVGPGNLGGVLAAKRPSSHSVQELFHWPGSPIRTLRVLNLDMR